MEGPGTVTWEEFLDDANGLLSVSERIADGWELRGNKVEPGGAYLYRRAKRFVPAEIGPEADCDFALQRRDPFEAETTDHERPLLTEYHILWSMSYAVPVLYFNGWYSDFPGINPVTVEEAQRLTPGAELKYTELSQAMHPILGTPFLQLHPCMSRELLRITPSSKNKLVSWLSVMAPAALGLKVKPEYCELTL